MALRAQYLNGRGSGCHMYKMLEPGKIINAIPYIGCMESKDYCISPLTII